MERSDPKQWTCSFCPSYVSAKAITNQIFELLPLHATAWSSLPHNSTHSIDLLVTLSIQLYQNRRNDAIHPIPKHK